MKRTVALLWLCLFLSPLAAPAADPGEQYVTYYQMWTEADQLLAQGKEERAYELYFFAQDGVKKLQAANPKWNEQILTYRLSYLAEKIKPLAAKYPTPVIPADPPPAPKAARPAPPVATTTPAPKGAGKAPATARPQVDPDPSGELSLRLGMLNEEIIQLRTDRAVLEKKLKEALAARPATSDPAELARAEARAAGLQKENDVLKATVEQNRKQMQGMVGPSTAAATKEQLEQSQQQLVRQARALAQLTADKESLEKKVETLSKNPELAKLKTETTLLRREKDNLEDEVKRLNRMSKATDTGDVDALKKELGEANRKLAQQATQLARVDSMNAQLQDAQTTISSLRKDNQKMEALLTDPGVILGSRPAPDASMSKDLDLARTQLSEARRGEVVARTEAERLKKENESLDVQLKAAMKAGGKSDPRDAARIKELEQDRDRLATELKTASKELNDRKARASEARVAAMADELAGLKAKLEVLEATKVPYSREELALFKRPETGPMPSVAAREQAAMNLSASSKPLVLEAERAFAARRFSEAEKKYEEALKLDGNNVNTLVNLAAAQIEQEDLKGAEKNLEKALALAPDDSFGISQMGYLRLKQKKVDEAITLLGRAAQLDPKNSEVQNFLGVALSEKGQRAAAEAALRMAIQLSPGNALAHHNLAVVYATQDPPMTELARFHYQKARSAGHPVNPDLEKMLKR